MLMIIYCTGVHSIIVEFSCPSRGATGIGWAVVKENRSLAKETGEKTKRMREKERTKKKVSVSNIAIIFLVSFLVYASCNL